jgi:hypothetical protein
MCFKKQMTPIIPMEYAERRLISAAINDYPGSVNDLRGCLNDSRQAKDICLTHWPDFDVRRLLDQEATLAAFKSMVSGAIASLKPGATVCVISDSCFSATNTRLIDARGVELGHLNKNRFYATPGEPTRLISRPFFPRSDIKWIAISACGETQTAADAYINDSYHGAFSWFAFRLLKSGITYRHWFTLIRQYLPSTEFDQMPTIEGPDYLLDSLVCSGNTLFIHNSTHGTTLTGIAEEDIDEAICFWDRNLRDNEYFELLNKIA